MENDIKKFLPLIYMFLFFVPVPGDASALIQDAVTKIAVITDRGDTVEAEADPDQLKKLNVEINGRKIHIDAGKYSDLRGPYLHSVKLYVDSSKKDGEFVRRLVIPFFEYQSYKDIALVLDLGPKSVLKASIIINDDLDRPIHTYKVTGTNKKRIKRDEGN